MVKIPENSLDFITCPICYHRYNQEHRKPLTLRECGHSICNTCYCDMSSADAVDSNSSPSCPICKCSFDPKSKILVNFALMSIVANPSFKSERPSIVNLKEDISMDKVMSESLSGLTISPSNLTKETVLESADQCKLQKPLFDNLFQLVDCVSSALNGATVVSDVTLKALDGELTKINKLLCDGKVMVENFKTKLLSVSDPAIVGVQAQIMEVVKEEESIQKKKKTHQRMGGNTDTEPSNTTITPTDAESESGDCLSVSSHSSLYTSSEESEEEEGEEERNDSEETCSIGVDLVERVECVFIRGLPFMANERAIREMIGGKKAGIAVDHSGKEKIIVYVDRKTGQPRGQSMVTFNNAEKAREIIEKFDGKKFPGSHLPMKLTVGKFKAEHLKEKYMGCDRLVDDPRMVFVQGVPVFADFASIRRFFGNPSSPGGGKIALDTEGYHKMLQYVDKSTGASRGQFLITFLNKTVAKAVIAKFDGTFYPGSAMKMRLSIGRLTVYGTPPTGFCTRTVQCRDWNPRKPKGIRRGSSASTVSTVSRPVRTLIPADPIQHSRLLPVFKNHKVTPMKKKEKEDKGEIPAVQKQQDGTVKKKKKRGQAVTVVVNMKA